MARVVLWPLLGPGYSKDKGILGLRLGQWLGLFYGRGSGLF